MLLEVLEKDRPGRDVAAIGSWAASGMHAAARQTIEASVGPVVQPSARAIVETRRQATRSVRLRGPWKDLRLDRDRGPRPGLHACRPPGRCALLPADRCTCHLPGWNAGRPPDRRIDLGARCCGSWMYRAAAVHPGRLWLPGRNASIGIEGRSARTSLALVQSMLKRPLWIERGRLTVGSLHCREETTN